jgi:RP/EB family microtubule-associated protein
MRLRGRKFKWSLIQLTPSGGITHSSASTSRTASASRHAPAVRSAPAPAARAPSAGAAAQQIQLLNGQIQEMQATCEGLEKERDFYFAKLRNIELIINDRVNLDGITPDERDTLAKVQEVLYQTEEGFEVS